MPITLNGDTGIQTPMYNGTITANAVTPSVNMKNRIINGAMVIDQRNAGASGTSQSFPVDRWQYQPSQANKVTWQQNAGSVTPPAGFKNYLGITSSSAYSVGSGDYFFLSQTIEGFNIADLGWGASGASTVTLSFWVRSSLTGTFGGSIRSGGFDLSYPFTYTISAANTWEQKSITIGGPTSGTFGSTNGNGLQVCFSLGAGSTFSGTAGSWTASNLVSATGATSVVGTNGATFYITGVQLEVGSTATSFDYRPYGTELALCQRYYEKSYNQTVVPATANISGNGGGIVLATLAGSTTGNTSFIPLSIPFKVTKRTAPTLVAYDFDGTANAVRVYPSDSKKTGVTAFANLGDTGAFQFMSFDNSSATSLTAYTNAIMFSWTASAEL